MKMKKKFINDAHTIKCLSYTNNIFFSSLYVEEKLHSKEYREILNSDIKWELDGYEMK